MKKHYTYRIIIEPDGKAFHGYVPALPGCHTCGKTVAETKNHLQEAIELYLEDLVANGEEIPEDQSFEAFTTVYA
jgi:antitoxin HicB